MEEDKVLFQKLKIVSLLDLALLIPISYRDTNLSETIEIGRVQTFEARVDKVSSVNGMLRISFYLPYFNQYLSSMIFRVTSYHHKLYTLGSNHYIHGKVEEYRGNIQMNQPQSLKKVGEIIAKYASSFSQNKMIASLIERYIFDKSLSEEGLNQSEISTIMNLHYPKKNEDIEEYNRDVLKFIEAFNYIKKLKSKRKESPPISLLNGSLELFIKNIPFKLTREQKKVIDEIKIDFSNPKKATRRMVIGDVGSGKTMVILASAVMAYPQKSILMAPTSLLALQIYEEAVNFLPKDMKIALVMQGKKSKGDYLDADFIVGTHAILFKDDMPKAPLVMVDEQHRFGTKQRAVLEAMMARDKYKPHFLQFSATPIPRTQAMMQSELIDVSLITTTPFKKDITSIVIGREDFSQLLEDIKSEISKNNQVLIVYPLVEESMEIPYQSLEEGRAFWEKRFEKVYLTHGKDKKKEEVLQNFREDGNILLATTVVEVGISLPRLTLIVIVGAERLGLATLHQLRGRVGRLGLKSWCYLFTNNKNNGRLKAFTQTNSGFEIAHLDLKFRNSGDIVDGTVQSGMQFKFLDLSEDENIIIEAKSRVRLMNAPNIVV